MFLSSKIKTWYSNAYTKVYLSLDSNKVKKERKRKEAMKNARAIKYYTLPINIMLAINAI